MAKIDQLSEAIGELRAVTEGHGDKLDEIARQLSKQNDILGKNTNSLSDHMMQTQLIRERNDVLRADHDAFVKNVVDRLKPIEDHVVHVQSLTRIMKFLVPAMGLPEAVYYGLQLLDWIKHLR
jgi:hypothetical protein